MRNDVTEVVGAIILSSICSVSMILLNKLVMFTYKIDHAWGLLLLQNTSALLLVVIAKSLGIVQYPAFDAHVVRKWLPLTVLFVLMLYSSMKSIQAMSVAVVTILKNLATVITAFGDAYFFQRHLSVTMMGSFGLMFVGAYLGTTTDPWTTAWGIFWTVTNIFSTVAYVLYMKLLLSHVSSEIGKYGPVFYNNLLSIPFLLLPSISTFGDMVADISAGTMEAKTAIFAMTLVGSVMTFATFWCMKVTSPTTYAVVGTMNKIPLLLLGIIVFDQQPTAVGALGMTLSMGGGALYTYLNLPTGHVEQTSSAAPKA